MLLILLLNLGQLVVFLSNFLDRVKEFLAKIFSLVLLNALSGRLDVRLVSSLGEMRIINFNGVIIFIIFGSLSDIHGLVIFVDLIFVTKS